MAFEMPTNQHFLPVELPLASFMLTVRHVSCGRIEPSSAEEYFFLNFGFFCGDKTRLTNPVLRFFIPAYYLIMFLLKVYLTVNFWITTEIEGVMSTYRHVYIGQKSSPHVYR